MYNVALKKLNGVLADFKRQYQTWKKETHNQAQRAGVQAWQKYYKSGTGPTWDEAEQSYYQSHQFNPHLVFDLPGEQSSPHPQVISLPYGIVLRWTGSSYRVERGN